MQNGKQHSRLFRLREHLRQSLWFLPTVLVLSSATAAIVLVAVDHATKGDLGGGRFGFGAGPEGARTVIATVAGSMVAFIGTVFSITILVLQLASSQFSPRALRSFLRDRRSQLALGVFLGTLVYSLVVLWTIDSADKDGDGFVPQAAMAGGYALLMLSLGTFVFFIHHVSQSIRVANLLHQIGAETLVILDKRYPDPFDPTAQVIATDQLCGVGQVVPSAQYGVLLAMEEHSLQEVARAAGGRIEVLRYVGDFVPVGAPLARWVGDDEAVPDRAIQQLLVLGRERTMDQDIAFGIRQLVDIAQRALSPGVNDPTTATQALDQIHNVLRQVAHRTFPHEVRHDAGGIPRLVLHERSWADLVDLAFNEIREAGAEAIQVQERLRDVLDDLIASAPPERQSPLERQRAQLERRIEARPR